jgi:hypothetical protein
MCIYGIFRDDLGFYYFQRKETTKSKEDTSNSKHATTQESIIDSSIQWDGTILQMFYKKICYYYQKNVISPKWQVEFHVHINASLVSCGAMLSQNVIGKSDQLVMYTFRLLNRTKHNDSTIERKALTMVFVLHKFKHYLLGNKFVFYVDHITLVYLINKPHVFKENS